MNAVADRTTGRALLGGGSLLAVAMMVANAGNYALNIALGRWLGPARFADANLMVTLMLVLTAIAVTLQLVSARCAGQHAARGAAEGADGVTARLSRAAWVVGGALALLLVLPAGFWSIVFDTASPWPFIVLGFGMPFYLDQAVGRGVLQGRLQFRTLAGTYLVEVVVRLGVAVALVALGAGVIGATAGLSASFVATWWWVRRQVPAGRPVHVQPAERADLRAFVAPVLVLLVGQILINNGDVLVVKSVFPADRAGVYAAVALVGRAVFFVSWSAVTAVFPAAAQRHEAGRSSDDLLAGSLAVVGGASAVLTIAIVLGGEAMLTAVLGSDYGGTAGLLTAYAVAASLFALANLIATHQLSCGRARSARLLLGGAVVQSVLLAVTHETLHSVVMVQVVSMAVLLVALAIDVLVHRVPAPVHPTLIAAGMTEEVAAR